MPFAARRFLRSVLRRARRLGGSSELRDGRMASLEPLSLDYGFDRGTPIDRHYIDRFLKLHSADIRGTALEVVDAHYCHRLGGTRVTTQHVVDVNPANKGATISGDLCEPDVLPTAMFDCIVLTQLLHTAFDMDSAVRQVRRALKPGGVALITVPGITAVRPGPHHAWYWSLTADALGRLLAAHFDGSKVEVATFGNLFAATNFLHGAAVEEIDTAKLDRLDAAYPVIVAARAVA